MYFLYKFELTNGYNLYSFGKNTRSYQDSFKVHKNYYRDIKLKGVEIYESTEEYEHARSLTLKMKQEDPLYLTKHLKKLKKFIELNKEDDRSVSTDSEVSRGNASSQLLPESRTTDK